jgi:uncharacterized membrane protein YedE/YeeE
MSEHLLSRQLATADGALRIRWLPGRQTIAGIVVVLVAIGLATVMAGEDSLLPSLWFLGIAFGFTLQRSRFCFASAFRDLFLFGSARMMKAILVGVAIASVGFAIIMYNEVPFPSFGALPQEARVMPVGPSTVIAGVLFGIGMVIAGGCTSGSIYRVGEGYVASAVAVVGMVIGLALLASQWNTLWELWINREPRIWLPGELGLGYGGAVIVTLVGLGLVFLLLTWWEARNGVESPVPPARAAAGGTFSDRLRGVWQRVCVDGWSPVVGGATLGVLSILVYSVHMPWGVTGELNRWAENVLDVVGTAPHELHGLNAIGGCAALMAHTGLFTHPFAMTEGLFVGALIGALFAGEFKLRFPPKRRRYIQALGGGIGMGYGAGLAVGCTTGALFSSVASLSVSGWLFGLSLAVGAYVGVQILRHIP